jgi:uncharacterized BrkB/YihY/UPF0761 family membrane protein
MLRVLIVSHRLVWTDLRAAAPRPTPKATLRLLGLLVLLFVVSGLAAAARAAWPFAAGLIVSIVLVVPYAGLWLLVSWRLPHRDAGWKWLVPGALLFAVGVELLQVGAAYFLAPWSLSKQGTYGALGIAAALLFGLYLMCRLVVAAAALNATLWERHARSEPS